MPKILNVDSRIEYLACDKHMSWIISFDNKSWINWPWVKAVTLTAMNSGSILQYFICFIKGKDVLSHTHNLFSLIHLVWDAKRLSFSSFHFCLYLTGSRNPLVYNGSWYFVLRRWNSRYFNYASPLGLANENHESFTSDTNVSQLEFVTFTSTCSKRDDRVPTSPSCVLI